VEGDASAEADENVSSITGALQPAVSAEQLVLNRSYAIFCACLLMNAESSIPKTKLSVPSSKDSGMFQMSVCYMQLIVSGQERMLELKFAEFLANSRRISIRDIQY